MKKRILCTTLSLCLCLGLSTPALATGPTFTDVPANHWAYASVEKMAEDGVMTGIGSGKFNPTGTVSNGEFFTMLIRAFYPKSLAEAQKVYGSGSDGWWRPAAEVAYKLNLVYYTEFGSIHALFPYDWMNDWEISRENMAQAVYNVLLDAGETVTEDQKASAQTRIGDWDKIDPTNQDAVAAVYALGLITGTDKGTFEPKNSMTRAEAAVVMDRLLSYGVTVKSDNVTFTGTGTGSETVQPTPTPTPTPGTETSGDTIGAITPASQVKASIGKSDAYPTKGGAYYISISDAYIEAGKAGTYDYDGVIAKAQNLSNNGYRTGANVEIGNAELVYELLDMVNEMRAEGGMDPVKWVPNDAAEEYTLLRAYETTTYWSHDRANGSDGLSNGEDIAKGTSSVESAFDAWKNSSGHYKSLMRDTNVYMCAAVCDGYWVITLWNEYGIANVEHYGAIGNYCNN